MVSSPVAIAIADGSGTGNGAASRWQAIFGQLGWHAVDQGTVHRVATTQVIDSSGGKGAAVAKWFATYFGVTVTTAPTPTPGLASPAAGPGDGGVTIVLGQDEERAFNNHPGFGS